jgi:hypothetical protein
MVAAASPKQNKETVNSLPLPGGGFLKFDRVSKQTVPAK